jgi:hypothetical protein
LVSVCLIARAEVAGLAGFCLGIISPRLNKTSGNETNFFIAQMLALSREALQRQKPRKQWTAAGGTAQIS